MKRAMDLLLTLLVLPAGLALLGLIALAVWVTSGRPVLHWSVRVGRKNRLFRMPKFRTMRTDTPQVATHLLADPEAWLTRIGRLLRRTSLDELPQLWSVLVGDMSLVGPRPALFNQYDLVALRTAQGVHKLTPGLTGWAQVNGRSELAIPDKVAMDVYYLRNRSIRLDLKILAITAWKVLRREGTVVPPHLAAGSSSCARQSA